MITTFSAGTGAALFVVLQQGGLSPMSVDLLSLALLGCALMAVGSFIAGGEGQA